MLFDKNRPLFLYICPKRFLSKLGTLKTHSIILARPRKLFLFLIILAHCRARICFRFAARRLDSALLTRIWKPGSIAVVTFLEKLLWFERRAVSAALLLKDFHGPFHLLSRQYRSIARAGFALTDAGVGFLFILHQAPRALLIAVAEMHEAFPVAIECAPAMGRAAPPPVFFYLGFEHEV